MKIIPKETIDKTKRIEHVKNEKRVLHELRKEKATLEDLNKIAQLKNQKADGKDDEEKKDSVTEVWDEKTPINFMVRLHETFVDDENVNFVFEYLPGQDLVWILANEHNLFLGKNSKRKDWV